MKGTVKSIPLKLDEFQTHEVTLMDKTFLVFLF